MSIPPALCNICHSEPPKYTCPQCLVQTCSLVCFNRHKSQLSCSGFSDTTLGTRNKYIPQTKLSGTDVQRDYNFLLHMNREMSLSKRKTEGSKILHTNKRRNGNREGWIPVRGVKVMKVPFGMERSKINKSGGGNNRNRGYAWTVEWIWVDDQFKAKDKYLMYRCDESKKLGDSIPKVWMEMIAQVNSLVKINAEAGTTKVEESEKHKIVNKEIEFGNQDVKIVMEKKSIVSVTQNNDSKVQQSESTTINKELKDETVIIELKKQLKEPNPNALKIYIYNKESDLLVEIPPDTKLSEGIRGRTVIEFPTLYVSTNDIKAKKVVQFGHENSDSESKSDSDSSTDSESKSCSSSSDSDESKDAEDSDGAPEESSTKRLTMGSDS